MKAIGFLIGVPGEMYMQAIGKSSVVYMEQGKERWFLWRENYERGKQKPIRHKVLDKGSFSKVYARAEGYFKYLKGMSA